MQLWSGYAKTAVVCVAIWAGGLLWMWLDFTYGSHIWTITPGPVLAMLAMGVAVPVFIFCVIVMLVRRVRNS